MNFTSFSRNGGKNYSWWRKLLAHRRQLLINMSKAEKIALAFYLTHILLSQNNNFIPLNMYYLPPNIKSHLYK